eukprot:6490656-Prymnesium_polylepis.1
MPERHASVRVARFSLCCAQLFLRVNESFNCFDENLKLRTIISNQFPTACGLVVRRETGRETVTRECSASALR